LLPKASERIDAQGLGPAETFDVENECGSGGCQQSVGDFLVHCHVAHHYFAGMWGLWRVYNTLQDGAASTDTLLPLRELPDREGGAEPAVTSADLVGKTIEWGGRDRTVSKSGLADWVEQQLPPAGEPASNDASVFAWTKNGDTYLNEPETDEVWPGYRSPAPGTRPPITFDPKTGKLAYPFLRPHLGKRPPFAPNHGPSPYLDPVTDGTEPARPGANGPSSVCPAGTKPKSFVIHAIEVPITYNKKDDIVDPAGELFVLKGQEAAVRRDNDQRVPLAIRANAGEDCVDVVLKSELTDSPQNHNYAKVNLHIHFVQFDVQASDGVIAGFNYEQSVRPFAVEGEKLQTPAVAGASSVLLTSAERFHAGAVVGVGMDQDATFEVRRIQAIRQSTVIFDQPLQYAHVVGEIVSTEFVRYRWYPDVQFGTAYFHDHVNAIDGWRHGLIGALISEPPGSTYHEPQSGDPIESGPIADIRTSAKVSTDVTGSFRELALFIQDNNPLTHVGRSSGSAFNLRAEPLDDRGGDPAQLFSSAVHGDPDTPVLRAYLGDPLVIRALVGATNDMHTLHVDGHWFRFEPYSATSPPVNTAHLGISERYDVVIPRAGGPQALPGDYLYYNGRTFKLREGSWGILRVLDGAGDSGLQQLPGHETIPPPAAALCPPGAPKKSFDVAAIDAPLPMLNGKNGRLFVLKQDEQDVAAGRRPPEPLVLHVNVGDCIRIDLANDTKDGPVSLHADMLAYDPKTSAGIAAGATPTQTVAPGEMRTYTFYAHPEVGETIALLRDWGNVLENPGIGLYGAIVVGPRGAIFRDPITNDDIALRSSWRVNVFPEDATPYRDFALFFQDQDESIGTHRMPYTVKVNDLVGLNYNAEPLDKRLQRNDDPALVFRSEVHGDPATPLLESFAGEPVQVHVLAPWSEQAQVFSIEGHAWPVEPRRAGSSMISAAQIGGLEATTFKIGDAGGSARLPGDYLYGDHREPYREAGLWGLFRVYPEDASAETKLLHLQCVRVTCGGGWSMPVWAIGLGAALVAAFAASAITILRRRTRPRLRGS
ncbi:MAG: hypothetical protein WBD55_07515, partial [Dehalococcoidia bacterium]